jgi:hypothetical protein
MLLFRLKRQINPGVAVIQDVAEGPARPFVKGFVHIGFIKITDK